MKAVIAALAMGCMLSGCLVELLLGSAVGADMAAQQASTTVGTMNQAQLDTDFTLLQEAVEYYYYDKEAYPRDLYELVPNYIEAIPTRPDGKSFGYNPVKGEVYESGEGPAPADYLMMESLKTAINNFGMSTGYYPPTLDDLYPTYVPAPPRTASGQAYLYNNQNGRVEHPDEGKQYARSTTTADEAPTSSPVAPVNAVGSLREGDLKDSNSLNNALDRMGY